MYHHSKASVRTIRDSQIRVCKYIWELSSHMRRIVSAVLYCKEILEYYEIYRSKYKNTYSSMGPSIVKKKDYSLLDSAPAGLCDLPQSFLKWIAPVPECSYR